MEYLNHDPNWLNKITIEIDKFLIDREYIKFFVKMYMQWRKDDGYTSSSQRLIITRPPCFEKLALSQLYLYIESQTTTQCFMWCNTQKTILIRSAKGKEKVFCIVQMLRIHTGLRKLSKKNVYDLHLKKLNPFEIGKPCIIIARRVLLFLQYRMAPKRYKYDIEVHNYDAIKRNRILFDFMQRIFNCLDGLYLHEKIFW